MKKIINKPENFVDEMLEGIVAAYPQYLKLAKDNKRVILNAKPTREGKVGVVTAGGSGHLPVFLGYVGDGLLDGCAVGNVFASPSASTMATMIRECDKGAGVLCLYGNYNGDILNFNLACEDADFDDIKTKTVLVRDDLASSVPEASDKRRGVAGMVFAFKIAGAAASAGMSLDEVAAITQAALDNTRTMGVATSACIVPEVGKATFSIKEDEIEIGMGIHGEPGIDVKKMMTADEIADLLFSRLNEELQLKSGDEVCIMVNGLGATPLEELYIVFRRLNMHLKDLKVDSYMNHVGEFATSMEMAGLSITIMKLNKQIKELLEANASSPFYTNYNK